MGRRVLSVLGGYVVWVVRGAAVGYAGAGGRSGAVQCKAQAQEGYRLVFQDALGQQSGSFGAIAVA